ncbi:SpaA isopeptide-forming pilin-related protein [Bifidobacterium oedipodis]|nr:LPXTG cell wall anchor domain-containing protein [Bifidobacterium sp. DSM 109957]
MRKLFAGLVAAATLFGGLAMGVSSAYAEDGETGDNNSNLSVDTQSAVCEENGTTITLTVTDANALKTFTDGVATGNRTFKAVKLANYNLNNGKYLTLESITEDTGIISKLTALGYNQSKDGDAMTWLSKTENSSKWRTFADDPGIDFTNVSAIDSSKIAIDDKNKTATFTMNSSGLWLIVDTSGAQVYKTNDQTTTYHPLKNMLVGTPLTGANCPSGNTGAVDTKDTSDVDNHPEFEFKKINAQDHGVQGAIFKVYEGESVDNAKIVFFTGSNGTYTVATAETPGAVTELQTPEGGVITLKMLDVTKKSYYVQEYQVASGYKDFKGDFKLTYNEDTKKWVATAVNDPNGLVNPSNPKHEYLTTVLNVKTPSELPHTGGAGIAVFSAIGLLLAGAAGVVYMKLRGAKKTLIV